METPNTSRSGQERNITSLLIDPFRQIKFGIYMIASSLVFIFGSTALFINAFKEQYQHVMSIFNVVDPALQWEVVLNDVFYTNIARIGVFFLVFLCVMFLVIFKLTHRYYGPLVSIERFVEEMTEGLYGSRVAIRNKDELQRLVRKLNLLAEALEKKHGRKR